MGGECNNIISDDQIDKHLIRASQKMGVHVIPPIKSLPTCAQDFPRFCHGNGSAAAREKIEY